MINTAYTDPRVQVALARAGDSGDPPGPDGAAEVAGPPAPEIPLFEFSGLANGKRSSRLLSEFMWAQDFVRLCGVASPLDRAKLLEGRLPGAALTYVLVPMTSAFSIDNAVYTRMLQNFIGITGHTLPHSHDCGHAGAMQLGEHNQHHIQVRPIYGRALKAHDEVKFLIAHMVRQCGVERKCAFRAPRGITTAMLSTSTAKRTGEWCSRSLAWPSPKPRSPDLAS